MKTLIVIAEKIFGTLIWLPTFLIMPFALLRALRQLPRYVRSHNM